jgi:hypothetical protein
MASIIAIVRGAPSASKYEARTGATQRYPGDKLTGRPPKATEPDNVESEMTVDAGRRQL